MSGLVMPDGSPVPTLPPSPVAEPETPAAETAPAPPDESADPRDALTVATQAFFNALAAGAKVPIETVTGALEAALQALAAQQAHSLLGETPVAGVDYEILATPAQDKLPADVRINGLTPLGDALGALWQGYQHEVEYVAVKSRVALLSAIAQKQEDVIRRLQTQLDNVMMDVSKIRKKVGA